MVKILLVDECYPINTRNRKILESLKQYFQNKVDIHVITWDRKREYAHSSSGYHVYQKDSPYGHRFLKFIRMWGFYRYCRTQIRQQNPDIVIASHWNNLLMVPKLERRRQMLIYENLDMPSGPAFVRALTTTLEKRKMSQVDLTIHASRFFLSQYPSSFKQIVLENKPTFSIGVLHHGETQWPIRIAFIGNLRYFDILRNLVEAVRCDSRFHLYFHGNGPAQKLLEELANDVSNISFTGYYAYEDVVHLYEHTDIVWAAYPNKDFNVKYAISNKFHESLMMGVPAIYASQTCLGDYAVQHNIGLEVDPYSVKSIQDLLTRIADGHVDLEKMKTSIEGFYSQQTSWNEDFMLLISAIHDFFPRLI